MANVQFLRGAHSNLPTGVKIQDGAFYLTSDTNRLYVGKGTGASAELVELNKSVTIVDYVSTSSPGYKSGSSILPTSGVDDGQFYLAVQDNILCVYKDGVWKQINKNTDTTNKTLEAAASTDGTITLTLTDSTNKNVTDNFKISAGDNIAVRGSDKTVTIEGAKYNLDIKDASSQDENIVNVNLKNNKSTNADQIDDTIKFKAGNDIKLTAANDIITIDANTIKTGNLILTNKGQISLQFQKENNQNVFQRPLTTDAITYTVGGQTFIPGSDLPVYTRKEIDTKLNELNGMTYKGTVGTSTVEGVNATVPSLPTTEVKSGDTYLAISEIASVSAKKGDLIIATGTEVNGVITSELKWTVVPAGDDAEYDTHYAFLTTPMDNKIELKGSDNQITGTYVTTAGTQINVSSTGSGNSLTTEIAHGTIAREDTTATAANDATSVTFIEGVSTDNGHVTGTTAKTVNLRTYTVTNSTDISSTNDAATITTKLRSGNNQDLKTLTQKVSSNTLEIKAGTNNTTDASHIDINLVWGSF